MRENVRYPATRQARRVVPFRSPITFSLSVAGLFLAVFNYRFWKETAQVFWRGDVMDIVFLLALTWVLLFLYASALLLVPGRKLMTVVCALLFPLGAMAAFCADSFGLAIDREMIRNIGETNQKEAIALFSPRVILYVVGFGMLPVFFVARSRIAAMSLGQHLLQRAVFGAVGTAVTVVLVLAFASRFNAFFKDHMHLHYLTVPGAAVQGIAQFIDGHLRSLQGDQIAGPTGIPQRVVKAAGDKPLLLFLVVGETARHRNFQLGGYGRPTNPALSQTENLYYFSNVESCATTTAVSVPCMFSPLGRKQFNVAAAQRSSNVLTELARAGIRVEWRTNNSGSKGIKLPANMLDFSNRGPSALCNEESCLDEILLENLDSSIRSGKQDALVAFHQMGSHGPSYFRRYPRSSEVFTPACNTNDLSRCSNEEIRNAYDNTLVYTDHLVKLKIDLLRQVSDRFDTALIYVSDHGESLGENGVHLHGAPYDIAPPEQKKIPFMLWMSHGYMQRFKIDRACMGRQLSRPYSHDNMYHTLLGAMGTRNELYRSGMDMLAACQSDEQ